MFEAYNLNVDTWKDWPNSNCLCVQVGPNVFVFRRCHILRSLQHAALFIMWHTFRRESFRLGVKHVNVLPGSWICCFEMLPKYVHVPVPVSSSRIVFMHCVERLLLLLACSFASTTRGRWWRGPIEMRGYMDSKHFIDGDTYVYINIHRYMCV